MKIIISKIFIQIWKIIHIYLKFKKYNYTFTSSINIKINFEVKKKKRKDIKIKYILIKNIESSKDLEKVLDDFYINNKLLMIHF